MERKKPDNVDELTGNSRYEGFCADLAEKIAHKVGFNYEIRLVRDGIYGERLDNGTWTGMMGELTREVRGGE